MLTEDAARDLAVVVGLEWSEADRELLGPLVDAALVWAEDEELARIADPIVDAMWHDELREDIERALEKCAKQYEHVDRALASAAADLGAGPCGSRLARAVVLQAAFELAHAEQRPVHCLLCVEEVIAAASPTERGPLALRVARIASRAAAVPSAEIRAAVAGASVDAATSLATDDRRQAVRGWLRRLAELGTSSVPTLSAELLALLDEPLPAAANDELWRESVRGLVSSLESEWN